MLCVKWEFAKIETELTQIVPKIEVWGLKGATQLFLYSLFPCIDKEKKHLMEVRKKSFHIE